MPYGRDFIPQSDTGFKEWQQQFAKFALAHAGALGLDAGQQAAIAAGRAAWLARYDAHLKAQEVARAATEAKDEVRNDYKKLLRVLAGKIRGDPSTTVAQLEGLNLTVPDRERTSLDREYVLGLKAPVLEAGSKGNGVAILRWQPRRKPFGIDGVRVWVADVTVGGKPVFRYVGDARRQPFLHVVGNERTVTLQYEICWFDRLSRDGAFCTPATVAVASGIAGKPADAPVA